MRRRAFLRAGAAAAFAGPSLLALPAAARPLPRRAATPIRLMFNENPLGLPESARRAVVDAMTVGSQYPGRDGEVVSALAGYHGVAAESIVLGNGSTEVLQMVVQSVARRGGAIVVPQPTFGDVESYAQPYPMRVVKVPLAADYSHDLQRMRAEAEGIDGPVLVFICNPNNPTGGITRSAALDTWIRSAPANILFLVDEAYFDFVDTPEYHSAIPHVAQRRNVVVSRTFSKIFGLAGVRLGYALAHPDTAREIGAYAQSVNLNAFALAAGLAVLQDRTFVQQSLRTNQESRQLVERTLDEMEIERLPSHTNFVMHRVKGAVQEHIAQMRAMEILVGRPFPPMLQYNRVSLGTVAEMEQWAGAMRRLRRRGLV